MSQETKMQEELKMNQEEVLKNLATMSDEELLALMTEEAFDEQDQAEKEAAEASGSFTKIERIRPTKDKTIKVRVLPLLPGEIRQGYEYPLRQIFIKLYIPDGKGGFKEDKNGKKLTQTVPVIDAKYAFPELKKDLIDKFREMAVAELRSRNASEDVIKLVDGGSYTKGGGVGGLKFDSKRVAYCIETEDVKAGKMDIKMLEVSYAQYKDIEETKKKVWGKLKEYAKEDGIEGGIFCPMTSPQNGRALEITGTVDGSKIKYSYMISNNDRDIVKFTPAMLSALRAMPRINSEIYRYTRYHYTATLEFLKQYDAAYSLGIYNSETFQELINEVRSFIPESDTSSFEFKADAKQTSGGDEAEEKELTIETIEDMYYDFKDSKQDDKSEAGAELKAAMKEFAAENNLGVNIMRKTTIEEAWALIDDAYTAKESGLPAKPKNDEPEEDEDDNDQHDSNDNDEDDNSGDNSNEGEDQKDDIPATTRRTPRRGIKRD